MSWGHRKNDWPNRRAIEREVGGRKREKKDEEEKEVTLFVVGDPIASRFHSSTANIILDGSSVLVR